MMIAFDPSLLAQVAARPSDMELPLVRPETGADFATVMADRALLDVPASARLEGQPGELWMRREMSAPAALRFDEGPLFGRAFLRDSLSPPVSSRGVPEISGSPSENRDASAIGTAETRVAPLRFLGIEPLQSDVTERSQAPGALKVSAQPFVSMSSPDARMIAAPDDRLPGMPAFEIVTQSVPPGMRQAAGPYAFDMGDAGSHGRPASGWSGFLASSVPLKQRPDAPQFGSARSVFGPYDEPASGRRADEGVAGERGRQVRARFVDRLGPVEVLAWEDGGAVRVSARVALASASAVALLDRQLRRTVAEQGSLLSGLRINGKAVPAIEKA